VYVEEAKGNVKLIRLTLTFSWVVGLSSSSSSSSGFKAQNSNSHVTPSSEIEGFSFERFWRDFGKDF
jgi:hypothetical protein